MAPKSRNAALIVLFVSFFIIYSGYSSGHLSSKKPKEIKNLDAQTSKKSAGRSIASTESQKPFDSENFEQLESDKKKQERHELEFLKKVRRLEEEQDSFEY